MFASPEVLIIFQHGNNIINGIFYWYWHSKLTIIHEKLPAISIWHIQKNGGLFSAQTGSRGHLCLTSPKRGRYIKIYYKMEHFSQNKIKIYLATACNDQCFQILIFTKMLYLCGKIRTLYSHIVGNSRFR